MTRKKAFWREKRLVELSDSEWESLCDGCAKCCLNKLEDEDTGDIYYTRVACQLLDIKRCQCTDYANRCERVPDCIDLRQLPEDQYGWLPSTCAYRLVAEGKDLPHWHPLKTDQPQLLHKASASVRGRAIPESRADMDDLERYIVTWVHS